MSIVNVTSLSNLCRLCLEPDQATVPIFKLNDDGSNLSDKIAECLPVKISEEDELPKYICNTCLKSVDFVYSFWQLSSNSEKQLQSMIRNPDMKLGLQNVQDSDDNGDDHAVILYDTIDVKDVMNDSKDVTDEINENIEIKEVYFGEYLNNCDAIEDENTVLINENIRTTVSDNCITSDILSIENVEESVAQTSNIQISQIVETSNVSLRTFDEDSTLKLKLWDVALPDFFLIPYDYEPETQTVDQNAMVLMDIPKSGDIVVNKNTLVCHICRMAFSEQLPYLKHYEESHKQYKCPFCVKSFTRRYSLENHLFVHSTRRDFPCSICALKFKRKYDLKQHVKRMHDRTADIILFECDDCGYKTKHKNQLRIHVLDHLGISQFTCELCGKTFKTNLDFTVHRNNHLGIKPFQCDICGNHFTRKHYMLQHRRTIHEELYSYQCDICGRSFSYRTSLSTHLKVHTGENRVQCDICNKVVSGKVALINHKKIHSDEKEFVCGICGKVYINKYSLQEHVLVHTGSKPFQCLQCDKSFSTRKKLLNHEQIHDPVRSLYFCKQCNKSYLSKYKLNEHMQKRHSR